MYVRVLFGRYAGEVRDIESVCARLMLEDGRAENPFAEFVDEPGLSGDPNTIPLFHRNGHSDPVPHPRKKAKS